MSELQICCHLLAGCAGYQAQSLLAASCLLRETCSQFLCTLRDCVEMCSCSLAPPVSRSAVDRSSLHRMLRPDTSISPSHRLGVRQKGRGRLNIYRRKRAAPSLTVRIN
ncbi:hypothetical protein AAFF_G00311190 [Aldrovandia affinis]|uniref:Uncharacterized protein n=1 Tax=Aldrovandia affinis TaxID=143900 RepID=A0AAD7R861_9TELE|nr:hypothetical protein AAFF_G00311190 [Aldrovandia affinis]